VALAFLSQEWATALTQTLNENEEFKAAAAPHTATIQQVITRDGQETRYWTRIADDRIEMGVGDAENPDATITQTYETAVALAKRELNPVTGFMTGKIKVAGNMGQLMALQGVLGKLAEGMNSLDVDY
jgi:putative sterol carrier protein